MPGSCGHPRQLSVSSREVPLLTLANGTLMARDLGCSPRGPGEAACLGELARDLAGDQAAERVGVFGGQLRVNLALNLDAQGPAGPAGPGVRVDDAGGRPGGSLGGGDHLGSTPSVRRCTTSLVTS
jgi:hypothetical protein